MKNIFALCSSILIALILCVTAYGKLFFPAPGFKVLDIAGGVFELFFSSFLLFFYKNWKVWALSSFVFSFYIGISLYWLIYGLPCSCMGELMILPHGLLFSLDIVFWMVSLINLYFFSKRKQVVLTIGLSSLVVGALGYYFGYLN